MDNNEQLARFRDLKWDELVRKAWGKDWNKPDVAYEFSGGRTFESTDRTDSGIYGGDE
jgi:hypothetical protein